MRFLIRTSPGVAFERLTGGIGSCAVEPEGGAGCRLALPAGATGAMALRFIVDTDVPDRLVVVPSIGSNVLDVPVEFVSGLLVGQVDRGELRTAGATLGGCVPSPGCPNGQREASSAVLDLPAGATVERALLVWEGDRADASWAESVGLIPPGSATAVTVSDGDVPAPSGAVATGSGVGTSEAPDASGFRSVADVTDLVRAAGGGSYTVVRPPSSDDNGHGSWTLTVITESNLAPRRLLVVIRPEQIVEPETPLRVDIPVKGSVTPETPQRPARFLLQAATVGSGTSGVSLNGAVFDDENTVGSYGTTGGTSTYDLEIDSTEDVLSLVAFTTADALRLASIGLAADIVP